MIQTKYNIGDTVYLAYKISAITVGEDKTTYCLKRNGEKEIWYTAVFTEDDMPETDCIPLEEHEAQVNALKDEVKRWKEEYQEERLKHIKLAEIVVPNIEPILKPPYKVTCASSEDGEEKDYSHHPHKNIYAKMP